MRKGKNKTLLIFHLLTLRAVINEIKEVTEHLSENTTKTDVNKIIDMTIKFDISKEITKIESLFEISIPAEKGNADLFAQIPKLTIQLNNFLSINLFIDKVQENARIPEKFRPDLIQLLTGIVHNIDEITNELYTKK